MPFFRDIPPQHEVGAAIACPRCGATQLLHRQAQLWHCDICRSLLLRTRRVASLGRSGLKKPLVAVIVAFDSWLRIQLALIATALIIMGVLRAAPPALATAALGVCIMLMGTTLVVDAAIGLRSYVRIAPTERTGHRGRLPKVCLAAVFGCWAMATGGVILHLSLRLMDTIAAAPASMERQAIIWREAVRAGAISHPGKTKP